MTSSTTKVISADAREVTSAKASDMTSAEAADASSAKAPDVTSAKATHMATAKAAHVASGSAATTMSPTTAPAAGLGVSSKKAAGKHCTCQNHHRSSSHDILLWDRRTFRYRALSDIGVSQQSERQTSRWTVDGSAYLSSLLNSRSIIRTEYPARKLNSFLVEKTVSGSDGALSWSGCARRS
jgi:hypothetical protein